ncbi:uncharacterized protein LOC112904752 [Agrilus planipennis]|uniref:Uncharacterized protein LOC112904752 n=1 Tax=Agrilus planipennis TaxID=224129 RepID=A0A7F5R610_AGRPL|nr:uncharacterized protein LOC112904752 [Agrilus planipennis]
MSLTWIQVNAKLLEGIKLINSLKTEDVCNLLDEIVTLKDNGTFSSEKLAPYEKLFVLNKEKTNLVIKTAQYLMQRMSQVMLKPTSLLEQLMEPLQLTRDKAKEFLRIWVKQTGSQFQNLEGKNELEDIIWELNLQTSSNIHSMSMIPTAKIQFNLRDITQNSSETDIVTVNEGNLIQFCNTLEIIQNKIDSIKDFYNKK